MAVVVKRPLENQLKVYIDIPGKNGGSPINLQLDISLKRHCYRWTADAETKDENSVMYDMVSDSDIFADAKAVGSHVEGAVLAGVKLATISEGRNYQVATKRVYRVDTTSSSQIPNHFFPVSGPGIWSGINKSTFSAISHFRNLEVCLLAKFGDTLQEKNLYEYYTEIKKEKPRVAVRANRQYMFDQSRVPANEQMMELIECLDNVNLNTEFNQLSAEIKSRIVECAGSKPWHQNIMRFLYDFARSRARAT